MEILAENKIYAPTDCSELFANFEELVEIDFGDAFETENVTNMEKMFYELWNLKKLDVSHFHTQNVQSMESMFDCCSQLKYLNVSGFDTKNVVDMCGMFVCCGSLRTLDIKMFDTRNTTIMNKMFADCHNLQKIELNILDTRKVTDMRHMFMNCKSLNGHLDIAKKLNIRAVKNKDGIFEGCKITQFDKIRLSLL